jgi:hypothetical protein
MSDVGDSISALSAPATASEQVIDLHGYVGALLQWVLIPFALYSLTLDVWLTDGDLNQFWYLLHLTSWLALTLAVLGQLIVISLNGGWPLLRSMLTLNLRRPTQVLATAGMGAVGPRVVASLDRDEPRVGLMAYRR